MRTWSNTHREDIPLLRGKEMPENLEATEVVPGLRSVPFHAARQYWLSALSRRDALKPIRPMESFTRQALGAEPGPVAPEPPVAAKPAAVAERERSFREEGEYWQIDGSRIGVRNLKGLFYIQYLLLHPDEKIHVSNLAALADGRCACPSVEKLEAVSNGLEVTTQPKAPYGGKGRVRKRSDSSERVRKAVTKCIREAIDRIAKQNPSLGRHLRDAIQTGFFCSYSVSRRA